MEQRARLRWLERALVALGICLIGGAAGTTWDRWSYQAEQRRVLLAQPSVPSPHRSGERVRVKDLASTPTPSPPLVDSSTRRPVDSDIAKTVATVKNIDPGVLGRLEIPRLGVDVIVRVGADKKTLARAVGLVPGTARPGESGNIVLAGHRDTFFRPLRKIRVNDRIRLIVPPHEYEYVVDSTRVVPPEETSVLYSRGAEELTLVTCHPFYYVGPAPDRFIVTATRASVR